MKLIEALQKNNFTLECDPALNYDENKVNTIKRFIGFSVKELGLKTTFVVRLVSNREAHGIKTTAYWKQVENLACVYAKGRMLGDVMRSLAHELVHAQQWQQGRIKPPVQDVGGEIEGEANAVAGVIIKKFIYQDPEGSRLFE